MIDDKYTYPGSGGVLINKLGIKDATTFDRTLNSIATARAFEIRQEPTPEPPDFNYLRAIHRKMFGDILPFAGELRTTNVQAMGTGIAYCRPAYIVDSLRTLYRKLAREDYLAGLNRETFVTRLADRWGELTAIHPFRDGNTRSQSLYIRAISLRAGHEIDWTRTDVDLLRDVRLAAMTGNDTHLADYLRTRIIDNPALHQQALHQHRQRVQKNPPPQPPNPGLGI